MVRETRDFVRIGAESVTRSEHAHGEKKRFRFRFRNGQLHRDQNEKRQPHDDAFDTRAIQDVC